MFRKRFAIVPAAYIMLRRDDGQVLPQLRQNTGYLDGHWAVGAAGHVEAGEPERRDVDGIRRHGAISPPDEIRSPAGVLSW